MAWYNFIIIGAFVLIGLLLVYKTFARSAIIKPTGTSGSGGSGGSRRTSSKDDDKVA